MDPDLFPSLHAARFALRWTTFIHERFWAQRLVAIHAHEAFLIRQCQYEIQWTQTKLAYLMESVATSLQERAAQVLLTFVTDRATSSVSAAISLAIALLEGTNADWLLTVCAPVIDRVVSGTESRCYSRRTWSVQGANIDWVPSLLGRWFRSTALIRRSVYKWSFANSWIHLTVSTSLLVASGGLTRGFTGRCVTEHIFERIIDWSWVKLRADVSKNYQKLVNARIHLLYVKKIKKVTFNFGLV